MDDSDTNRQLTPGMVQVISGRYAGRYGLVSEIIGDTAHVLLSRFYKNANELVHAKTSRLILDHAQTIGTERLRNFPTEFAEVLGRCALTPIEAAQSLIQMRDTVASIFALLERASIDITDHRKMIMQLSSKLGIDAEHADGSIDAS